MSETDIDLDFEKGRFTEAELESAIIELLLTRVMSM